MTTPDTRQIEHYLKGEMPENDREKFEERLLSDDALFYETAEVENTLVDRYVADELAGLTLDAAAKRFLAARSAKAANAVALRGFIEGERRPVVSAETESAWSTFLANFGFRTPTFGFAAVGLALMLAATTVYLFVENRTLNSQVAQLEQRRADSVGADKTAAGLAEARSRESNLQALIDEEKIVAGDLTADLERERRSRRELESELASVRRAGNENPQRTEASEIAPPNILAVTLPPATGDVKTSMKVGPSAACVSILLNLPPNIDTKERFTVRVNGDEIARGLASNTGGKNTKTLSVWIKSDRLRSGENLVEAFDGKGQRVSEHRLTIEKAAVER